MQKFATIDLNVEGVLRHFHIHKQMQGIIIYLTTNTFLHLTANFIVIENWAAGW